MSSFIEDTYKKQFSPFDIHIKSSFEIQNTPLYIANSFRRAMSSEIPTVTFDDTYYDSLDKLSINIKKNTSALHNQYLSHRIALIPINMELPNVLSILKRNFLMK